jgi:hypothetical protein
VIPQPAIAQILEGFLIEQRERLPPAAYGRLATVLDFLRSSLDRFGYVGLDEARRQRWEAAFDGGDAGAFGNLFGAAELVAHLDWFQDVYLPERAKVSAPVQQHARGVTTSLRDWLAEKGYLTAPTATP